MMFPSPESKLDMEAGQLKRIESKSLSGFKTRHVFDHFAVFRSVDQYIALVAEARLKGFPVYILGKGSNTWFYGRRVRSAVLKNELPVVIDVVKEDAAGAEVYISSTTPLMKALRFCEKKELEGFWFLASVPGNIGGAIAMNAGGAPGHPTIFDFVETVSIFDGRKLSIVRREEISTGHRKTEFTGVQAKLIVGATFRFKKSAGVGDSISERIRWYKANQDTTGPTLGTVFAEGNGYIFGALKRLRVGFRGAHYSAKWPNWIVCKSGSLIGIRLCVAIGWWAHKLLFSKCRVEMIRVD